MTDDELYRRGIDTLLACWEENARGARGAGLVRLPGVAVAVFPAEPERSFFDNAMLAPGLDARARVAALDAMETTYALAGIVDFAAWVHESDAEMIGALTARGYSLHESTRAMGMDLAQLAVEQPTIEIGPPTWAEHLRILDVPGLFSRASPDAFHILTALVDDDGAATAMAFDCDGDCGIFNVSTLPHARRRGLGSALTVMHLHLAIERGCRTASLQSTAMADGVYASIGFRDLGRILEYVRS